MPEMQLILPIAKIDTAAQIVYGVVLKCSKEFGSDGKPTDFKDTDGNWATEEQVKKACHKFNRKLLKSAASKKIGVDKQHNGVAAYGSVIESYIAKSDVPEINACAGDWVAAVEVTDKKAWDEIEKGEITGFSVGGKAVIHTEKGE